MRSHSLHPLLLTLLAGVMISTSCSSGANQGASAKVDLIPNPRNALSATISVEAEESVRVDVTASAGSHVVEVPRTADAAETHEIALVGLRSDQDYTVDLEFTDDSGEPVEAESLQFSTGSLPEFVPELAVTVDEPG